METRPTHNLHCWYNIDMALIALAIRLGGGATRRGKNCVKARHTPRCSLFTTHFSSTANTILFVSVHYPQMLDHCRQTPSGGLDWSLSPTNTHAHTRQASFWMRTRALFQTPAEITEKTKCNMAILTHTLSLEVGTGNVLLLADYQHRFAFAEQHWWLHHTQIRSLCLLSGSLTKMCPTCRFIPTGIKNSL